MLDGLETSLRCHNRSVFPQYCLQYVPSDTRIIFLIGYEIGLEPMPVPLSLTRAALDAKGVKVDAAIPLACMRLHQTCMLHYGWKDAAI